MPALLVGCGERWPLSTAVAAYYRLPPAEATPRAFPAGADSFHLPVLYTRMVGQTRTSCHYELQAGKNRL